TQKPEEPIPTDPYGVHVHMKPPLPPDPPRAGSMFSGSRSSTISPPPEGGTYGLLQLPIAQHTDVPKCVRSPMHATTSMLHNVHVGEPMPSQLSALQPNCS